MHVCISQSIELADTSWIKTEVQIDETDFKRILVDHDLDPLMQVPTALVFQLMEAEAQSYLLAQLMIRFEIAMKTEANIKRLGQIKDSRAAIIAKIKALV